ncbi:Core-2/I-Branching enzyme [Pedobacter antarcticus]|nr:beta-1,6-N-acetylglucosaminyltransferase [Pedobacter antarcticus]SFE44923.1 Core-2/I-Branching enzyme [Pedobacter antarcticus]
MRHAYLIIAHNEFEVLQHLLNALDDKRNDVFIHIDKKVKTHPNLHMREGRLSILKNTLEVYWGHISQIEAEYLLFETAHKNGSYAYYHLISGVHLPLYNQSYLHAFFDRLKGKDLLMKMDIPVEEVTIKVRKYNFFIKSYFSSQGSTRKISQFLWRASIRFQKIFDIIANKKETFYKASNWLSLSQKSMDYVLKEKSKVLKKYRYSFCGDEFFVPSILENMSLKSNVVYYDKLLKCDFEGGNTKTYSLANYDDIINSGCLFARKFSVQNINVVEKILTNLNSRTE